MSGEVGRGILMVLWILGIGLILGVVMIEIPNWLWKRRLHGRLHSGNPIPREPAEEVR